MSRRAKPERGDLPGLAVTPPLFAPRDDPTYPRIYAMLHMLLADKDERDAVRLLRGLRQLVRSIPDLVKAFGVRPPPKGPGRPRGRRSLDPGLALAVTVAIDLYGFTPIEVLRFLGRRTNNDPAPYRWIRRHREVGRTVLAGLVWLAGLYQEELASLSAERSAQLETMGSADRKALLKRIFSGKVR